MSEVLRFVSAFGWFLVFCGLFTLWLEPPHDDAVVCGDAQKRADECFKDLAPKLMRFLHDDKIAITKEDLSGKCDAVGRGLECFDNYIKSCLQNRKLNSYENHMYRALRLYKKFCAHENYQRDFQRRVECFPKIKEDWKRCNADFQKAVVDGTLNTYEKSVEFCCVRFTYENCIYNSIRYKCPKNSAKFARETAKMLANAQHLSNCRSLKEICVYAANISFIRLSILPLALVLLLRYVRSRMKK